MKKLTSVCLFILFLIGGCRPNGEIVSVASATPAPVSPQLGPFIQDGAPYNKSLGNRSYTIPNCSGSQVPLVNSPSFGVDAAYGLTWEVNGEVGFGMTIGKGTVPGGVDLSGTLGAAVQSGIEQSFNMQESWELSAGPGEVVTYTIEWVEIWQPGYVEVSIPTNPPQALRINIEYRSGMESNMVGSSVAECDDHMAGGDGAPDNGGSSGPERFPTCNWATDWALQSNDTYLWVGLPPGSSGCNNVGQDGELLARLRSGAKLTLVVEIGDNPVGIDICSGRFSATTVSDGQTCASDNPSVWPQVTGTLVVEDSTGFLVGTGQ